MYGIIKKKGGNSMLQKAMKFLKWGQMGITYVPKAKDIFSITKRFLPKKKIKIFLRIPQIRNFLLAHSGML